MKKYSLIKTFAIFSAIAFILTGLILSFVISRHIISDKLDNVQELARITTKTVTRMHFSKTDLDQIIPRNKEALVRSDIIDSLKEYNIASITLINGDRTVIMSSDTDLLGKSMPPDVNSDMILRSDSPFVISDQSGVLVNELNITIYEPVTIDGIVEGLFVLKLSDQVIKVHVSEILQAVAWTLAGGLLLLFLLLIGILYRTSKALIKQNEELVLQKSEIEKAYAKLNESYRSTMLTLSNAVDVRDPYTAGHSDRVTKISLLIANKLNMAADMIKTLECAALFHDIGKLGISETILLKNGKLTIEEYELIKKHPDIGASILKNVDFLQDALPIIRHHHERFSGDGYPDNIAKEKIPLGSRIIAIADTYDAMTSDRPYRKGLGHDAAVQEILKNKGTQFDDQLVDVFMKIENEVRNI
ncbi:MAG: HD-GYP domain-containing protein [Saccharofermentanales bacterium]